MRKFTQTRFKNDKGARDNSLATVIACITELGTPEEVIQVQDFYTEDVNDATWELVLDHWLNERGWSIMLLAGHLIGGGPYLVTGTTNRDKDLHVCIYEDGELIWDPHPDNTGIQEEVQFELLFEVGLTDTPDVKGN